MLGTALFLALGAQVPVADGADLLPVYLSGRWGHVDLAGEAVAPFRYTMARAFREGLAGVRDEQGWHFVRPDGARAFEGDFVAVRDFREGRAAAAVDTADKERWGLLAADGSWIGEGPVWLEVGDFAEGLAPVRDATRAGYLDLAGALVRSWRFAGGLPSGYHDGKAAHDEIRIGVGVGGGSTGVATDREGGVLFEVEGGLRRLPQGFLHEHADGRVRLLDDSGQPAHEGWFDAAVLPAEPGPVPVRAGEFWAYFDLARGEVVGAGYTEAYAFSGGFAAAREGDGPFGYLGPDFRWRIEPAFSQAADFRDGRGQVKLGDEVCWIDEAGELIWNPQLAPAQDWELAIADLRRGEVVGELEVMGSDEAEPITLGEAVGVYRNRQAALIHARTRAGAEVVLDAGVDTEPHFVYAFDLSWFTVGVRAVFEDFLLVEEDLPAAARAAFSGDDLAALLEVNNERIARDLSLHRILVRDLPAAEGRLRVDPPKFYDCRVLTGAAPVELHLIGPRESPPDRPEDLLPVPFDDGSGAVSYWSPVDFGAAFEGEFEEGRPYSEGLAAVRRGGRFGFIDLEGRMVIEPRFANTSAFSEGWCVVADADTGLLGYVDRDGRLALPCRYQAVGDFHQGRAMIRRDGAWGFLGRDGEIAITPAYQAVGHFASGLAPFQLDGKVGYLGLDGAIVVPAQYQSGTSHVEGLATAVAEDGTLHYLDAAGRSVISGPWSFASDFLDGLALVQEADTQRWSLIDRAGEKQATVVEVE